MDSLQAKTGLKGKYSGNVEKSRQRRSLALPKRFAQAIGRHFAVLTY